MKTKSRSATHFRVIQSNHSFLNMPLQSFQDQFLRQETAETRKLQAAKEQEAEELKASKLHWRVYHYATESPIGIAVAVFLLALLCLSLLRPSIVCRRAKSMYMRDSLDFARVFALSAALSASVLVASYFLCRGGSHARGKKAGAAKSTSVV